jgi:Golgin subfamily A member 7/ERF4 family
MMTETVPSTIPVGPSLLMTPSTTAAGEDPFLTVIHPLKDENKQHTLSRPVSNSSRRSEESRADVSKGEGVMSGVILIGMDGNDAATTTASRRSSSVMDPNRPSETNDTDRDDGEVSNAIINDDNIIDNAKQDNPPSSRQSNTSRNAAIPVMSGDHRRSDSISSASSSDSNNKPTGRPRQTSSVDPPETLPTTITSPSSHTSERRHSATEFQKFRHQLHSVSANPVFLQSENSEWPLHPNPHHPKTKTEILRIERTYTPIALPTKIRVSKIANYDVLIPKFSPSYPPILGSYGINETEWTGFIQRVNRYCMEAFDPFRWSNVVINILAIMTFWLSEWIMPNLTKKVQY